MHLRKFLAWWDFLKKMGWEAKLDIKEALQIGNHTTKEKYKHNLQKQEQQRTHTLYWNFSEDAN